MKSFKIKPQAFFLIFGSTDGIFGISIWNRYSSLENFLTSHRICFFYFYLNHIYYKFLIQYKRKFSCKRLIIGFESSYKHVMLGNTYTNRRDVIFCLRLAYDWQTFYNRCKKLFCTRKFAFILLIFFKKLSLCLFFGSNSLALLIIENWKMLETGF